MILKLNLIAKFITCKWPSNSQIINWTIINVTRTTPIVKMFHHRWDEDEKKKCPHFTTVQEPHGWVVNYGEITRVHLTREILFLFPFAGAFHHTPYMDPWPCSSSQCCCCVLTISGIPSSVSPPLPCSTPRSAMTMDYKETHFNLQWREPLTFRSGWDPPEVIIGNDAFIAYLSNIANWNSHYGEKT